MTMFQMSNDSHLFHTRNELEANGWTRTGNIFTKGDERMLPLYEGRMGNQYNHRLADSLGSQESTTAELRDPIHVVQPQY